MSQFSTFSSDNCKNQRNHLCLSSNFILSATDCSCSFKAALEMFLYQQWIKLVWKESLVVMSPHRSITQLCSFPQPHRLFYSFWCIVLVLWPTAWEVCLFLLTWVCMSLSPKRVRFSSHSSHQSFVNPQPAPVFTEHAHQRLPPQSVRVTGDEDLSLLSSVINPSVSHMFSTKQ